MSDGSVMMLREKESAIHTSSTYCQAKVRRAVDDCHCRRGLGSVESLSKEGPHGGVTDENESEAHRPNSHDDLQVSNECC
jgi:hypothetical protein